MSRYLLAWDLTSRRVLVVGGGTIAQAKVESLLSSGARITVVCVEATPRLRDLADRGTIRVVSRRFRPTDVVGVRLVVAATADRKLNRRVRRWAHIAAAVVNVVDDPEMCDVTVPAVVHRGPATIAISTDGTSPAMARFLREEIERTLPIGVGTLIDEAGRARQELRRSGAYRYDYQAWRQRFLEPGLDTVRAGRTGSLEELRRRFLAGFSVRGPIRAGTVSLVGAGPGGADLITVRGANALASADVVIYDRLADPSLLDLAPVAAERIPVGKSKGDGIDQEEINRIIVDRAASGAHVVRLKGGDPFVFGRGFEEREVVEAAGLTCDLVPGLSSALAAPALAGVPVTHRGMAASFTVLSGHRVAEAEHDWEALARSSSTLVVLMGASTASEIAGRLLEGGRGADESVRVVHRAGSPDMETSDTTLAGLFDEGCPFPAPCVIVIGGTASLGLEDSVIRDIVADHHRTIPAAEGCPAG